MIMCIIGSTPAYFATVVLKRGYNLTINTFKADRSGVETVENSVDLKL